MQPDTDFQLYFECPLSRGYERQLRKFVNERIKSYSGDYIIPMISYENDTFYDRLFALRKDYKEKLRNAKMLPKWLGSKVAQIEAFFPLFNKIQNVWNSNFECIFVVVFK